MNIKRNLLKLNKVDRVLSGKDSVLQRFIAVKLGNNFTKFKQDLQLRIVSRRLARLNKWVQKVDDSNRTGTTIVLLDKLLVSIDRGIRKRKEEIEKKYEHLLKPFKRIQKFDKQVDEFFKGDAKVDELPIIVKVGLGAVAANVFLGSPMDSSFTSSVYSATIVPFDRTLGIQRTVHTPEYGDLRLYDQYRKPFMAPEGYTVDSYVRARNEQVEKWASSALIAEGSRVTSRFGKRSKGLVAGASRFHMGMDFGAPEGSHIRNLVAGKVITSKMQRDKNGNEAGYGNYVQVLGDDGYTYTYAHMYSRSVNVGDRVEVGDILGLVGNTGVHGGNHLHFDVRKGNVFIPPEIALESIMNDYQYSSPTITSRQINSSKTNRKEGLYNLQSTGAVKSNQQR